MTYFKHSLVAALALTGLALGPGNASAMPNGLPSVAAAMPSNVENVRWICGPYRCWWRPWGGYGYYAYGPRPWGPRWGWGWHRWYRW